MASSSGQRIRLVKCPKCFKILQEDEDVPVYQCGGCSAILQAKRRSIAPSITPSAGETNDAEATKPETNSEFRSSGKDTVLPTSSSGRSSVQEDEKARDRSMESIEQLGRLELSNEEEKTNEIQLVDSDKNKREDNSTRVKPDTKTVAEEATRPGSSSGSLSAEHVVDARASNASSCDAYRKLEAEISPEASPVEDGYIFHNHKESPDDYPPAPKKTPSAYDGSESSSDEREDQIFNDNEQWKALEKIRSGKFGNNTEQGESSSSAFSEKRPNGTITYNEWQHQNRPQQLEGSGGRLGGGQGRRRYVTEQLRPDVPLYPREPYTQRVSPSYASHDEFDRYSRAQSLQMYGGMNHEFVDYTRARGRGQGSRFSRIPFSADMANDRRHNAGWYSGQLHSSNYSSYTASPQRPMMEQQPEYYPPRWSREIVSDAEDHHHQRRRHRHELQQRQRVAKRHVRPTAGGAPFVSCYRCSENLQLPVDFLIFKRKHHLLRCGTCTTVLRFSLQSRTHLVPAVTTHKISANNRSSNSTSESPREKKPEKLRSSVQEDEESSPVARGSPLHRLMGYSTVSQVFKASQRPPSI